MGKIRSHIAPAEPHGQSLLFHYVGLAGDHDALGLGGAGMGEIAQKPLVIAGAQRGVHVLGDNG